MQPYSSENIHDVLRNPEFLHFSLRNENSCNLPFYKEEVEEKVLQRFVQRMYSCILKFLLEIIIFFGSVYKLIDKECHKLMKRRNFLLIPFLNPCLMVPFI